MKAIILSFLILGTIQTTAQTTYPSGVTGCIARWDFTNTGVVTSLPDVSGNGHNGTAYVLTTAPGFRNTIQEICAVSLDP